MNLEKPWAKPYQSLLVDLDRTWPAVNPTRRLSYQKVDPFMALYTYRVFEGDFGGERLEVDISEFPDPGYTFLEGADNVEYLRLQLRQKLPYDIKIRREVMIDRIRKAIGLDWEFQTGNQEFDKEFFIAARTDRGKRLLVDPTFQSSVKGLSPFTVLGISPTGLFWSRHISDKSQLTISAIEPVLGRLHQMLQYVSGP
ncbi:MAG: hypothetical protein KKA42_10080 [candidate division Zixibacteria bacterium]|nr:hypothetical protein [candidate division Zixibacteria bacterium]